MFEANNRKVLIVDEDEQLAARLHAFLTERGFRVAFAHSAAQAEQLVARVEFELVLTELNFTDRSGFELIKRLKADPRSSNLCIVAMGEHLPVEGIGHAIRFGATDFWYKPLVPALIEARLHSLLPDRSQTTTHEASALFRLDDLRQKANATHSCPRCKTVVDPTLRRCGQCGHEPKRSWVNLADTTYDYLGKTISGRYYLDRYLGGGATASVYRARDIALRRSFAIKIIERNTGGYEGSAEAVLQRTRSEIQAMARIENPHVVKINDIAVLGNGDLVIVMDYVRGKTLGSLLNKMGRLHEKPALQICKQVAQGLVEAHQFGMIHRDIKPDNIMVEKLPAGGLFARVLDFGVVHMEDKPINLQDFVGTPLYCAPEQVLNRTPDARTDIYGLGAVLFHALTGRPPFDATSFVMILQQHVQAPLPSMSSIAPIHPVLRDPLETMVRRMMAKEPNDRYGSMIEVVQSMERLLRVLDRQSADEAE